MTSNCKDTVLDTDSLPGDKVQERVKLLFTNVVNIQVLLLFDQLHILS